MFLNQLKLVRDDLGRLVLFCKEGVQHVDVLLVCAFPLTFPLEHISILNTNGQEVGWIESLTELSPEVKEIVEEELNKTASVPEINNIVSVSSLTIPNVWHVETNKGMTQFALLKEDDIRNISSVSILINDSHGLSYLISNVDRLNKQSRDILERFCILG